MKNYKNGTFWNLDVKRIKLKLGWSTLLFRILDYIKLSKIDEYND